VKRGERKEQTRQALLDAAVVEFGRYGFRGARVEGIAEAAGVTTGALYTHFRSKEDLFLAVHKVLTGRIVGEVAGLAGVLAGPDGRGVDDEGDPTPAPGVRGPENEVDPDPAPIDPAGRPPDLASAADAWLAWHAADPRWFRLSAEFLLSAADMPAIHEDVVNRRRQVREQLAQVLVAVAGQRGRRLTISPDELALLVHALGIGIVLEQIGDPEAVVEGRFGRWVDALVTYYTEEGS
jgi:AcrR family transcriptional regulator